MIDAFVHRRIVILEGKTPAHVAAKAMRDQEVGSVLVTDSRGRLTGIVTDRDFASRWAADFPMQDVALERIMTPELLTVPEDSRISDVLSLMENHGVRRVPVVRRSASADRVVGIVTLDDLIVSGEVPPSVLARIVRRQIRRRLEMASSPRQTSRAAQRSDSRAHQTLDRFYTYFARATGLSANLVPQVTHFILGSLVMRMTATGASHLIPQLPKLIQSVLSGLPSGPDRQINAPWITAELTSRHHFTEEFSRSVLTHFLAGLGNLLDAGTINHLKTQMPKDLQAIFPGEPTLAAAPQAVSPRSMDLKSPSFEEGQPLPVHHTGDGQDLSPPLSWSGVPAGTREFALVFEDLDPLTKPHGYIGFSMGSLRQRLFCLRALERSRSLPFPSERGREETTGETSATKARCLRPEARTGTPSAFMRLTGRSFFLRARLVRSSPERSAVISWLKPS